MKKIYTLTFLIIFSIVFSNTPNFTLGENLAFVPNKGQIITDAGTPANTVHYKASVHGLEFYITDNGISYVFLKHNNDEYDPALGGSPTPNFVPTTDFARTDMILKNAIIDKNNVVEEFETESGFNYYYAHCPNGLLDLKGFHKLTYKDVYHKIDWVIYSDNNNHLKYEFVVHPGGNPSDIKMEYKWAKVKVEPTSITLTNPMGEVKEQNLIAYIKETSTNVSANFFEVSKNVVSVNVPSPSAGQTLIIDPPLYWSTYWGSAGAEQPQALICSGIGEYVFIAGYTSSTTYPTLNPGGGAYYQGTLAGGTDAFVAKFDTVGVLYWTTYYGGSASEGSTSYTGISIAVGQGTDLWMVGTTNSTNLPLQNAGGGAYYQAALAGGYDFFVVKFNLAGVRQHATYVGGTLDDGGTSHGNGADCDGSGNLYFSGRVLSTNFPMVNPGGGAYFDNTQNGSDDLCIVKLTSGGSMIWSTYLGGTSDDMNYSMDLHVDKTNSKLYVGTCTNSTDIPTINPGGVYFFQGANAGGTDAYFARFTLAGVMNWATYVGGSSTEWLSMSLSTAPDGDLALITLTGSTNMPCVNPGGTAFFDNTYNGTNDIYICRFEQTGAMSWGTYYGSANNEHCQHNLTMDGAGNIIMCCVSDGTAAPPTFNPGLPHYYKGVKDAQGTYCLIQFDPVGTMLWGTFWGGSGHDHLFGTVGACIGVSAHSDIFVTGETTSTDLPMLNPGGGAFYKPTNSGGSEGFVAKFENDILSPLPIELTAFTCEASLEGVNIFWTTASEFNNDYFTIEKTKDGNTFEVLTVIPAAGSSASSRNYSYLDKSPDRGANYYRLSQTDKNGHMKYFKLIACEQSPEMNEEITINIYSITGQFMHSQKTSDYKNYLDNSDLARGVYLVELVGEKETRSIKYVKAN